jgi:hypothetical protein
MQKFFKPVIALALAASLSGCYSLTYSADTLPDGGASMSREANAKVVRHFKTENKAIWIIAGLLPIASPNLPAIIRQEAGDRPVRSLVIRSEQSFFDGLISAVVGGGLSFAIAGANPTGNPAASAALGVATGLIVPYFRTITVEGDIVELAPAK